MTRYRLMTRGPQGLLAHVTYATRAEVLAYLDGRYPAHDREPCPDAPGEYRVGLDTIAWIASDPPECHDCGSTYHRTGTYHCPVVSQSDGEY